MKTKILAALAALAACAGCQGRPVPRDVTSVERAIAGAPIVTPESLSPAARVAYERDRVEVVPLPPPKRVGNDPARPASYKLQGSSGPITENEFVRRYRALSADRGLDDVEHWRTPVFGAIAGFVGASALAATYFTVLAHTGFDKGPEGGADGMAIVLAPALVAATGAGAVIAVIGRDGAEDGHEITEDNAVTYARRYNQLLLLRAAGITHAPLPERARLFDPKVRALVGPAGIGVGGTF